MKEGPTSLAPRWMKRPGREKNECFCRRTPLFERNFPSRKRISLYSTTVHCFMTNDSSRTEGIFITVARRLAIQVVKVNDYAAVADPWCFGLDFFFFFFLFVFELRLS